MHEEHDESDETALQLTMYGRVQGVSYRASAQSEALRLGLQGWVRNRHDGSVEALAIGPRSQVEEFVAWARNGPRGARVDLYLGAGAALLAFSLAGLFENNWGDTEVQRMALFLLAVPFCLRPEPAALVPQPVVRVPAW